ncbi:heme exporter protein CcmD [Sphingomonas swuensis]
MNQWAFVIAAYAVTLGGTAGLLGWSLLACRRAEARAERIGRER